MHFHGNEITKGPGSSLIDYNPIYWFIELGPICFLVIGLCLLVAYFRYHKTAVQPPPIITFSQLDYLFSYLNPEKFSILNESSLHSSSITRFGNNKYHTSH